MAAPLAARHARLLVCAAREWSGQQEPELVDDRKQVIDPMSAFQITNIMEGVDPERHGAEAQGA